LSRLGKHVVDPSRSLGFGRLDNFVMEQLAVSVLLIGHIGPFAHRKSGIEQYVALQIVGVQVCRAVKPLAVLFSELAESRFAIFADQRRSFIDQRFGLLCLL